MVLFIFLALPTLLGGGFGCFLVLALLILLGGVLGLLIFLGDGHIAAECNKLMHPMIAKTWNWVADFEQHWRSAETRRMDT